MSGVKKYNAVNYQSLGLDRGLCSLVTKLVGFASLVVGDHINNCSHDNTDCGDNNEGNSGSVGSKRSIGLGGSRIVAILVHVNDSIGGNDHAGQADSCNNLADGECPGEESGGTEATNIVVMGSVDSDNEEVENKANPHHGANGGIVFVSIGSKGSSKLRASPSQQTPGSKRGGKGHDGTNAANSAEEGAIVNHFSCSASVLSVNSIESVTEARSSPVDKVQQYDSTQNGKVSDEILSVAQKRTFRERSNASALDNKTLGGLLTALCDELRDRAIH